MSHRRTLALAAVALWASLGLAAGDRGTATIDSQRMSATFPSGKFGDYAISVRNVREKEAIKEGALVVSGTARKAGASAQFSIPTTMGGPFTADLVVDLEAVAGLDRAPAPRVFFGLSYGEGVVRGIEVDATAAGVDAFIADPDGALSAPVSFTGARLALHFERTADSVIFEAGVVGRSRATLGAIAYPFGTTNSSLALSVDGLVKGETISLDDLSLVGAVNEETGVHVLRLATVLGLERDALAAAAGAQTTLAKTDLENAATIVAAQIAESVSEKGGSGPARRKALALGIAKMKLAGKHLAKAKKLLAAAKDVAPSVNAAIDATLAAAHVLRGMSVAEPWDAGAG